MLLHFLMSDDEHQAYHHGLMYKLPLHLVQALKLHPILFPFHNLQMNYSLRTMTALLTPYLSLILVHVNSFLPKAAAALVSLTDRPES